jgi:hypothetical protein
MAPFVPHSWIAPFDTLLVTNTLSEARSHLQEIDRRELVQQRLPVGGHPSRGSRYGLTCRMRVRRKQFRALDHPPRLVIVEPVLTRLKAGDDRMPGRRRMLRCMPTWRAIAASDVPTLGAPAEMKPPTPRGRQALHAPVAARFRSRIDSAGMSLHLGCAFDVVCRAKDSRHQQDFPHATLFYRCLGLGRFTERQL